VTQRIAADMNAAAEAMEFEKAARLRDRIRALAAISMEQSINPQRVEEADVFAVHSEGGQACVQVFFFRAGQNWGNRAYFPRVDKGHDCPEILNAFLPQFYADRDVPRMILLSHEPPEHLLLAEAFSERAGRRSWSASRKRARSATSCSTRPRTPRRRSAAR
jgi:excinuclease ABC subunit C